MNKHNLDGSFLNTNYIIIKNKVFKEDFILKINTKSGFQNCLPELKEWAFITAWNPLPDIFSLEENVQRNLSLLNDLHNYKMHQGVGISEDGTWFEDSFFIENISLKEAHFYAKKYKQLAFVYGEVGLKTKLIYTDIKFQY